MPRRTLTLERKFGLFQCTCDPESNWASAHVYCVFGTRKVYFKQKCQNCDTPIYPHNVWNLRCEECGLDRDECECICIFCDEYIYYDCTCDLEDEPTHGKPHRRDLCMKCLAGFPCIRESDDHDPRRRRRRRRRRYNIYTIYK